MRVGLPKSSKNARSFTIDGQLGNLLLGDGAALKLPWKHPQQARRHDHVPAEFSDGHVHRAGPKRHFQPARYCAQGVAYDGQPTEQTGLWPQLFQPDQGAVVLTRCLSVVDRLVCAPAHPPAEHAAQCVAGSGHQDRWPKQLRIEFDQAKQHRFGAHGQQGGRNEGDHKHSAQAMLRQRQPLQQLIHPDVHQASLAPVRPQPFGIALQGLLLSTIPRQVLKY